MSWWMIIVWVLIGLIALIGFPGFLSCFFMVRQQQAVIVERFGKFQKVARAGIHIKAPWWMDRLAARLSLRIKELIVPVETITKDKVTVRVDVAVQYQVIEDEESVKNAFYQLSDPMGQFKSYVFDTVRARVPQNELDEVYDKKDEIAKAVEESLSGLVKQYGYRIVTALVNDVDPDKKVKEAMNNINAAKRNRIAAEEEGEAKRILAVKQAEADKQSKILQGEGIAGQRKAIIDGLKDSVEEFKKALAGVDSQEVMKLVLMTQYFDTMKDVAQASKSNTIFLSNSPGAVGQFMDEFRQTLLSTQAAGGKTLPENTEA